MRPLNKETPMHNDTETPIEDVDDEPTNYVPAIISVVAIFTVPAIYTQVVRRRRAQKKVRDMERLRSIIYDLDSENVTCLEIAV